MRDLFAPKDLKYVNGIWKPDVIATLVENTGCSIQEAVDAMNDARVDPRKAAGLLLFGDK